MCAYFLSCVWLFATPWTVAWQAALSMGFPRQEYCSELPFPSPGDLPNPGTEAGSPVLQEGSLSSEPARNPRYPVNIIKQVEKNPKTFRQTPGVEVPDPICRDKGNSMTTCPTSTPTFSSMVMVFTGSFLGTYSGLISGFPVLILPWVRIIFLNCKVFLASSFSFWLPVFSFPSVFDSPVYCVPVFSRMASEQGNAMREPVGKFWCGKSACKRCRAFWTVNGLWIGHTRRWVTRWLAQIQLCAPSLLNCERWRIDAFELWCWRRLLRVPWTARRSNQSILKAISPEYSLEGLMLKLKFQFLATCFEELTHWKRPWCWERLKVGGEGDDRGWDGWMASLTQQTWLWVCSRSWQWTGRPGVLQFMVWQRVGYDWATELNWTV